jgi:hypothetical protein
MSAEASIVVAVLQRVQQTEPYARQRCSGRAQLRTLRVRAALVLRSKSHPPRLE